MTHQKDPLHVKVNSRTPSWFIMNSTSLGPQPGPRKGDKKPVYALNITIPPIFVDNHVEPSKSAVNIQVGHLDAPKSRMALITYLESHDFAFLPLKRH